MAGGTTEDAGSGEDAGTASDAVSADDAGSTDDAGWAEEAESGEDAGSTDDAASAEEADSGETAGSAGDDAPVSMLTASFDAVAPSDGLVDDEPPPHAVNVKASKNMASQQLLLRTGAVLIAKEWNSEFFIVLRHTKLINSRLATQ